MHVEVKTIPSNTEVAELLDLKLCELCGHPRETHFGFHHSKGLCQRDCGEIAITLNGLLSNRQKKDLAKRLTNYYETVSLNDEARRFVGSGI